MAVTADVAVIGLGATGSAALYQTARRGLRAIGIEQFDSGHDRGSSHGRSRIIRLGYFEHPSYVPLVQRAYAMWRELERQSGRNLLTVTSIVEIGAPDSELVSGTMESSRRHNLAHEVLDARDVMRRYPAFRLPRDFVGVVQPDGGFLDPEQCIPAQLDLAQAAGAQLRLNERVTAIEPLGDGVRVKTEATIIDAGCAIVAAGGWASSLLPEFNLPLRVTRQVLMWFAPLDPALFAAPGFPVFMLESEFGIHYGFPLHTRDGLKAARHHHADETTDPLARDRPPGAEDEAMIRAGLAAYLPAANGRALAAQSCRYTMTPDGDFIIDRLPGCPQIILASPCSGHGFKFAPAVGEILAALARGERPDANIERFRLGRFG
jgi:sarcosine oxidase